MWQTLSLPFLSGGGDSLIGRALHDAYRAEASKRFELLSNFE
jgi:hypothetical protein